MEGRCQCSQIRFTTPLPRPLKVYVCHCTECRHQSSAAYGITTIFPSFEIPVPSADTEDAEGSDGGGRRGLETYARTTLSGRRLECVFCKNCGVRLMHRVRGEETLSVKGGCLEALSKEMMRGATHIWCKEAIVDIPEGAERWDEEPEEG